MGKWNIVKVQGLGWGGVEHDGRSSSRAAVLAGVLPCWGLLVLSLAVVGLWLQKAGLACLVHRNGIVKTCGAVTKSCCGVDPSWHSALAWTCSLPGDGVHHLDVIHERGHGVDDVLWGAIVHGFQALLQRQQVFDVVLCLVAHIRDPA